MSCNDEVQTLHAIAGDTGTKFRGTIYDAAGAVVDLTTATLTWKVTTNTGTEVLAETATGIEITNAENGEYEYILPAAVVSADLIPTGKDYIDLWLWIVVADSSGKRQTLPSKGRRLKLRISRSQ